MSRALRVLLKILGYGALSIVALIVVALIVIFLFFPRKEEPSAEVIERTPERLARGEYLVNHVASCMVCHSERDWGIYSAPVDPATAGQGTYVTLFGEPYANSANLTPFGLGDWSDGEVVRAITAGVKKDGSPVHPLMSFDTYAKMGEEDVKAVVAYLRTLKPIERTPPPNELNFLFTIVSRIIPKPWEPQPVPSRTDKVAYGRYLVEMAECGVCHRGTMEGGRKQTVPAEGGATVMSANLTPDPTGIGGWSRENFIGAFKAFTSEDSRRISTQPGQNTVMPWVQYAGMTEEDLGAIYDYLRTLPPVKKQIPVSSRPANAPPPALAPAR